jgi:hypothetical protein
MTDIIEVADLAAILRTPIPTNDPSAMFICDLANRMVTDLLPVGAVINAEVESITLGAAKRAWANPLGLSSTTRAFDDTSRTDRWEHGAVGDVSSRAVYLTDDEKADLLAAVGSAEPVQTIMTSPMFLPGGAW